ncbi:MAG TPA: hypothetical protein VFV50_08450 [Bdellovibrionales bacterium]|nr:hypothetical protein [Bdellovibrionales bacterium]
MRRHSLFETHSIYADAALVGAHANAGDQGFRQKDFRFLIELFSNWMDATLPSSSLDVHNTQILRQLEELTRLGFLRKHLRGRVPRYHLTPHGLLESCRRLVTRDHLGRLEEFYFLYFFVSTYRGRIAALTEGKSMTFTRSLRVELEDVLDPSRLLRNQIELVKREIEKLRARVSEGIAAGELAQNGFASGHPMSAIISAIEKQFPYELNNQKPLSELMTEIPEPVRRWELETGPRVRAERLWAPARALLESYLSTLEALQPKR